MCISVYSNNDISIFFVSGSGIGISPTQYSTCDTGLPMLPDFRNMLASYYLIAAMALGYFGFPPVSYLCILDSHQFLTYATQKYKKYPEKLDNSIPYAVYIILFLTSLFGLSF